jgi:hypothetical protein
MAAHSCPTCRCAQVGAAVPHNVACHMAKEAYAKAWRKDPLNFVALKMAIHSIKRAERTCLAQHDAHPKEP